VYVLYIWVMTIARRGLKVKVMTRGHWVRVSKDSNAVGLTSVIDRGQFSMVMMICREATL